jgi:hypothetical protein
MSNLIQSKERQLDEEGYLIFTDNDLKNMTEKQVEEIVDHFRGHTLMQLPASEIAFFEWLKKNDRRVWNDLWGDMEEPYQVSIDFLNHFREKGNGFPICDLMDEDNFWFSEKHIKPKGWQHFDVIQNKIKTKEKLTIGELLMVEIVNGSIDIWHFCYRYQIPISQAKKHIDHLIVEDFIVHLSDREDLLKYIDV